MIYKNESFDEERALYESNGVEVEACRFEGPADGESAFKESKNIKSTGTFFGLRYPFWHDDRLIIESCEMSKDCRAALWYSKHITVKDSRLHGIKALRECKDVSIEKCDIISPEFGWFNDKVCMKDTSVNSEYFMMRSKKLDFINVELNGKYSFQYIQKGMFDSCRFDTKDAFWHAKNVTIKDSVINGEYLGWYSENLTFINCTIRGTQPFCYCKNLKLYDCSMLDCDLAFEKSAVSADIITEVTSIKNPKSGKIRVKGVGEIISDDPKSRCKIEINA